MQWYIAAYNIAPIGSGVYCVQMSYIMRLKCWKIHSIHMHTYTKIQSYSLVYVSYSHSECVDVLVHLVQKGDGLDDHVVRATGVELDLYRGGRAEGGSEL